MDLTTTNIPYQQKRRTPDDGYLVLGRNAVYTIIEMRTKDRMHQSKLAILHFSNEIQDYNEDNSLHVINLPQPKWLPGILDDQ